jgi:histidinol-phosphate aminotransferase
VVFVANPNNPTGSFLPKGDLARLHAGLPSDVLLVIDQAYGEYGPAGRGWRAGAGRKRGQCAGYAPFPRSMALRANASAGPPARADRRCAQPHSRPFNLSNTAQAMGLAAVADQALWRPAAHMARRLCGQLNALGNHGVRPLPSEANFVLILFEGKLTAERSITA